MSYSGKGVLGRPGGCSIKRREGIQNQREKKEVREKKGVFAPKKRNGPPGGSRWRTSMRKGHAYEKRKPSKKRPRSSTISWKKAGKEGAGY